MSAGFAQRYGPAALVTGASSGIGRAFAETLAGLGMDLVLAARRQDRLDQLAAELAAAHGVRTHVVVVDLARTDAPQHLLDATADRDVGLVVSNAGFSLKGEHAGNDPALITEMLMVNCHVPLQLTRGFIPRLRQRRASGQGGGIVLTSSIEGLIGCPYSAAYSATKALVKALGEGLWAELAPEGIDVLTLCPGATDTEALAQSGVDRAKMPHVMDPAEVARLALDNIASGPTFISSAHYQAMFDHLLALPRREALTAMAAGFKGAATPGA